jgi:DNA-binding response OmpR family regulator
LKEFDVMIVEDEPDLREVFAGLLRDENLSVLEAHDGAHALELMKAGNTARLALCDIMMPRMDGLNFVRAAILLEAKMGIIMLTAYEENEKILDALRLGAIDYIVKPVKGKEFVDRVYAGLRVADLRAGRSGVSRTAEQSRKIESLMRVKTAGARKA